jgi:tetratricopeptide (TPR) repeat protein
MKKHFFGGFIALICVGCASGTVFVDTLPPGGEVYLKSKSNDQYEMVGTAPFQITAAEFREKYAVEGPFGIEGRLSGYMNQSVIVSELPTNSDLNVFLTLKSESEAMQSMKLNSTMDQIFESQRLVKVGRYDDALVQLNLLQQQNPNLSVIFEMQGGVFYIQKNYPKALDAYEKAARLNPNNLEVASMKKYLEKFVTKGTAK